MTSARARPSSRRVAQASSDSPSEKASRPIRVDCTQARIGRIASLLARAHGRLDDQRPPGRGRRRGRRERSIRVSRQLVGRAGRLQRGVDREPARRHEPLLAPRALPVLVPRHGQCSGPTDVGAHPQRRVVHRVDRQRARAGGIEHDQVLRGAAQQRFGRADREGQRRVRLERLAEGVPDRARQRHAVRRAAAAQAADADRVAPGLDLEPGQLRLDLHVLLAQRLRIDRVRELDPPGLEGQAAAAPAALVAADLERPVGAEGPRLVLGRAPRSLGRRCAACDHDLDRASRPAVAARP